MKIVTLLSILCCLIFSHPTWSQSSDTSFPTIENNPNVPIDLTVHSEPEPSNMKPKKRNRKGATLGESQSFFTDIISGAVVFIIGVVLWIGYRRWQANKEINEDIEE